ncbi:murein biosynthesis integral membrane protein MurJ [Rubrivirga sp. S365]|uniref:Probable lipid II flippase MurJ n=1 Tax=Rubrivirga litoralis TaxID=3075598 RepID=A0ABU3BPU3_9BACT|nr:MULTISPECIES: murein biosynthesis integral membrane protein MurJ [unclassified Rubrivirga]MDT0631307.1 murein biosynthesis integral membrane protein MurJ [Rubrivirga sp. F394]MDT7855989.1 murein biosynthesis integral membrane protein MurJ [Rubrivirga sp. S365]
MSERPEGEPPRPGGAGSERPDDVRPAPQSVAEPQTPAGDGEANEPSPDDALAPSGLSAPDPGAEALAEADAAPGSPAEAADVDPEAAPPPADPPRATPPSDAEGGAGQGEKGASGGAGSGALLVAAGIFASRVIGLVRDRAVAFFFGSGAFADVYRLALRAPNFLQNLLGEGTLSASFIPIYSRMLEEGREEEAGRFAGAIFGLLAAVASAAAVLGVLLAEPFVAVIASGFLDDADKLRAGTIVVDRFELSVRVVRLTFPMTAFLVLSAWALGVLNSHRKFLLSYFAPVAWNVALIAALFGGATLYFDDPLGIGALDVVPADALSRLLVAVFVGGIVGGILQFGVQLPTALKLMKGFRPRLSLRVEGVREAIRAFVPVVLGRGAYQLSGYLDFWLSTFVAAGALGAIGYAQTLYLLPISLFGMSVAASELPELSRISKAELDRFLGRVSGSVRQIFYLIVPTVVGYLGFGSLVVGAFYQTGQFDLNDTWQVTFVLMAYTLGMTATTAGRLLQNAFYALNDTKTPARIAVWRVAVSAVIGAALMFYLDRFSVSGLLGIPSEGEPLRLGAVGLALGSAVGAWVELWRLVRALRAHEPAFRLPWGGAARMLGLAGLAAIPAAAVRWLVPADPFPVWLYGAGVVAVYGLAYLALGHLLGLPESDAWLGRFLRRAKRG